MNGIGGLGIGQIGGFQGAGGLSQAGQQGNLAGLTARQVGDPTESPFANKGTAGG